MPLQHTVAHKQREVIRQFFQKVLLNVSCVWGNVCQRKQLWTWNLIMQSCLLEVVKEKRKQLKRKPANKHKLRN